MFKKIMFEEGELDDIETNLFATLRSSNSVKTSKQNTGTKKLFDINDNDLLDLLSDGESDELIKPKRRQPIFNETKENKVSNEEEDNSVNDNGVQFGSYVPTNSSTRTRKTLIQPIIKSRPTNGVTSDSKKASVHFADHISASIKPTHVAKDSIITGTVDLLNETPSTIAESSTQLSTVFTVPNVPVSIVNSTPTSPLSSVPLSSVPLSSVPLSSVPLSNVPSSSVPLSSVPLSRVSSSSVSSSSLPSNTPVLTVSITPSTNTVMSSIITTTATSSITGMSGFNIANASMPNQAILNTFESVPENIITSNKHEEVNDKNSSLLFGSYIPSSMTKHTSGRRRQTLPIMTAIGNDSPPTRQLNILSSPLAGNSSITEPSPVIRNIPTSSISMLVSEPNTVSPPVTTSTPTTVHTINSTDTTSTNVPLFTQPTIHTDTVSDLPFGSASKLVAIEVERDTQSLSIQLEETRVSLQSEKELRENEKQMAEKRIDSVRQEMEESFKSKEERLIKELNDAHQEEITKMRQDHEQSISYWKDLLASESRRDEINKLQESQKRVVESLDSTDDKNNTSIRLLTELTNEMQDSLKQMNDFCSSQYQHQSIEATKQKDYLQPLVQTMEAYLKQEKFSLSEMERSVLRERTTFEDERNKMLMEMKQEREALQKSKEHFLSEQQAWMTGNYTEKHHAMRIQTIANETLTSNQKLETELKCLKVSLDQEKATLSIEQSKLLKDKQKLEQDKTKLNHDQQALLTLEQNLKLQTLQVNRTSEIAQEVHKEGQQALTIAHRIQEDLNRKVIKLQKKEEILSTQQYLESNVNALSSCECNEGSTEPVTPTIHTTVLSQLEHSQIVRDTISKYRRDDERLEEELHFLQEIRIGKRSPY